MLKNNKPINLFVRRLKLRLIKPLEKSFKIIEKNNKLKLTFIFVQLITCEGTQSSSLKKIIF